MTSSTEYCHSERTELLNHFKDMKCTGRASYLSGNEFNASWLPVLFWTASPVDFFGASSAARGRGGGDRKAMGGGERAERSKTSSGDWALINIVLAICFYFHLPCYIMNAEKSSPGLIRALERMVRRKSTDRSATAKTTQRNGSEGEVERQGAYKSRNS